MQFKTLRDFVVAEKRVLLRCDFNVPVNEKGDILDDYRIRQSVPTIKYLVESRAKVVVISHLDPESTNVADKKYNLSNVAQRLGDLLNMGIERDDALIGPEVENQTNALKPGQVLLLENLRFEKGETENSQDFAKQLSFLGDIYANDAFSVCHRKHASIVGVPRLLPKCAGLLLEKEVKVLDKVMVSPEKPMVAIIGGKKVETKTKFINKISEKADFVIISGLLKKEADEKKIKFLHPEKIIAPDDNLEAKDISDKTIQKFSEKIAQAETVLWNGPFGKFEEKEFAKGTLAIAEAIIKSQAYSVVGGGETVEFLSKYGMLEKFSHVSTGGGAMMAYLSGEKLPGLEALED
jgi:phosphoglycerate kinase